MKVCGLDPPGTIKQNHGITYDQKLLLEKNFIANLEKIKKLLKGAVSRNSAKLGNYKMPVKLRET